MKKAKISIIIVQVLMVFCGCIDKSHTENSKDDKQEAIILQRSYYENSKVNAERTCIVINGDTIPHGYGKLFYPTGQLQLSVQYNQGKKQGEERGYYENGMLEHVGWYDNNAQDSIWLWYYNIPNATKEPFKTIEFWDDGKQISHQTLYRENGMTDTYLFCDPLGRPIYKRVYDLEGNVANEEGMKTPQVVIVTTNENIHEFVLGDTLKARIFHIQPPATESYVYVRVNGIETDWKFVNSGHYYQPIVYTHPLTEKGQYTLEVKLQLKEKPIAESVEFINHVAITVR